MGVDIDQSRNDGLANKIDHGGLAGHIDVLCRTNGTDTVGFYDDRSILDHAKVFIHGDYPGTNQSEGALRLFGLDRKAQIYALLRSFELLVGIGRRGCSL